MRSDDEKSKELLRKITIPLLKWYDLSARVLPWRLEECDPYKTLVSEIMLQQTRVETVKPYFERFISELPDVNALARVPEDRLMKLWEGLGYYSRARNLHKAAGIVATIQQEHLAGLHAPLSIASGGALVLVPRCHFAQALLVLKASAS